MEIWLDLWRMRGHLNWNALNVDVDGDWIGEDKDGDVDRNAKWETENRDGDGKEW